MELWLNFFQYIIVPIVAFFAGLLSKWFLQSQKARDDTLRSLASRRAESLSSLWSLTTSFAIGSTDASNKEKRLAADKSFRKWYYEDGGALLLSWNGTKRYFLALDVLRDESSHSEALQEAFSRLRTQLKRDCGIYSWWNTWRQLPTPRAPLAG
jgi:hypothetical protein